MRARVQVKRDHGLDKTYPGRWAARVSVRTGHGQLGAVVRDAKGHSEAQLSAHEVAGRGRSLLNRSGLDDAATDDLIAATLDLPDAVSIDAFERAFDRLRSL